MKELEGNINGFGYNPTKTEEWKEITNQTLKQREEPYRVVKTNVYILLQFFTIVFFIGILTIGGFFIYYVHEGKLQQSINQSINVNPTFDPTTNNKYDFNPQTKNYFNNTINLNLDSELIYSICNPTNSS